MLAGIGLACGPPPGPPQQLAGALVAAGARHTCAIVAGGAVRCWGDNASGQLGRAPSGAALPDDRVDLGTGNRAIGVFAGTDHTCAIVEGGAVKCWGLNSFGQLGVGDTTNRGDGVAAMGDALPFVDLGTGRHAVALAAGATAMCALLDDGRVKCWGEGYQGALGYGDTDTRGATPGTMGDALAAVDLGSRDGMSLTARHIVAIDYHSFCAIVADSAASDSGLKCWGSNDYCELGIGTRQGALANEPATTGDGLPWIDVGRNASGVPHKAVAAAAGFQFICVLRDDGAVTCWGDNGAGQLGVGEVGATRSCVPEQTGGADLVPLPARAVAIGARGLAGGGGAHACALLASGAVTCWGDNAAGQLGTGDTRPLTTPSSPLVFGDDFVPDRLVLGNEHSCAISADDAVTCWGSNRLGQLGPPVTGELVLLPSAGRDPRDRRDPE